MEEGSFPRGRLQTNEPKDKDKASKYAHRKRSKSEGSKTRRSDDILFGKRAEDAGTSRKKRKKSPADEKETTPSHQSLLPLGGGAVVLPKDKSGGGEPLIEGLGFAKLSKGFRVLGCVREVHADLAVFSLPNLWTGYMLRASDDEPPCDSMLQVGQFLSVVIVKAVQEPVKGGGHRRRIQVSCLPNAVNKVISTSGALNAPLRDLSTFPGAPIRCQIVSIEDHGVLMSIGSGKKGFLAFSDVDEEYVIDEDMAMEDETEEATTKKRLVLGVGRILDCMVKSGASVDPSIISLSLPSHGDFIKHTIPSGSTPSLAQLQPGMLVQARVERIARNGLCVTFCGNMFRGAIEVQHLGGFWIPTLRQESDEWKQFFKDHRSIPARIIAVDVSSKIIRLSLQSHILEMEINGTSPDVGSIIKNATVVRLDRGVGALLAFNIESDKDVITKAKPSVFKPLSSDENYQKACQTMAVYVHISKAMDKDNQKLSDTEFGKEFAPSSKHDVRVISASNWIDGIASGAAAPSIVDAQVISYADIEPAAIYRQVPVTALLEKGSALVDLGMGVKGVIPDIQLFDKVVSSEYRTQLRKVKFSPGTKVDVRVLTADPRAKRCILTAKKSMVKTDKIIKTYDGAKVGDVGTGFVSKVDDQGLIVTFFDGVHGRLTARSLSADAGVENHKQDYSVGDVLECRITNIKRKIRKRPGDKVPRTEELNLEQAFYELTLGLNVEGTTPSLVDDHAEAEELIKFTPGAVLPLKSMRIVELVHGKSKGDTYVPGYAIVNIKTKYLTQNDGDNIVPTIDCKLPFDQLLDEYEEEDIETVDALDKFAENMLTVGKKVNRKGFVLLDPEKSTSEYLSGTGTFAVVSIRPRFTEALSNKLGMAGSDNSPIVPDPTTHLYKGARLVGYVSNIDKRHGAFVRYLNGLTGLVPKQKGGLLLRKYSSLLTEVVAVDRNFSPPKLLVKAAIQAEKKGDASAQLKVGDIIEAATITYLAFHQVSVELDVDKYGAKERINARVHCTMAHSKPLEVNKRSSIVNTKQEISACHPFHGWEVGQKLSNLKVIKVESKEGKTLVELTNDDELALIRTDAELSVGQKVSGVIYSVKPGSGLWISVSPGVLCHIPALEASANVKILNSLESAFPIGGRLVGTILDREVWSGRRSKSSQHRRTVESKGKETPIVSLLDPIQSPQDSKPGRGDILIGRINRFLVPVAPPSLMLDLRGGFVGRCCITELEEPDDWENMPLGQSAVENIPTPSEDRDPEEPKDKSVSRKESRSRQDASWGEFPHAKFVQCRVLSRAPSKPLVDVSLRQSRLDGDLEDDEVPEEGEHAQAFVVSTTKKGCFVRLSHNLDGRVILKELCDGFLPNPDASFPMGRLVVGKVKSILKVDKKGKTKQIVDLDLRESVLLENEEKLKFEDIELGQKYTGTVTRLEEYGVFVRIDSSDVSGLAHKSECSDKYIRNLSNLYDPGDKVKLLVLKKDELSKKLGFSLKASHFMGDDDDDDDSEDDSAAGSSIGDEIEMMEEEDPHSGDEGAMQLELHSDSEDTADDDDMPSGDSSSDEDTKSESKTSGAPNLLMDTNVGFDWGDKDAKEDSESDDSDENSSDSDEEGDTLKASHKSRRKQAQRRKEEREISKRENALADGTADDNPETEADFERLIANKPNSSELWIRFMAFHLSLADITAAREVANRAFSKIEFREESEKMNVWCALLTLELKYGTEGSINETFERACQHNNPKHVHLRFSEILEKDNSSSSFASAQRINDLYLKMCKKFRTKKKVWLAHMEYLLKSNREEEALAVSKKSVLSLPPYKHIETLSKFAQLVFEYGNVERGRTLFDGLLRKAPKRLDIFFVYTDKEVKHGDIAVARSLFERVCNPADETLSLKLSDKKMKSFFKKWYAFEEQHGTVETQERVKEAARQFVERSLS